jgi:hypothetical protein
MSERDARVERAHEGFNYFFHLRRDRDQLPGNLIVASLVTCLQDEGNYRRYFIDLNRAARGWKPARVAS